MGKECLFSQSKNSNWPRNLSLHKKKPQTKNPLHNFYPEPKQKNPQSELMKGE